jgi:O-acetyl-ADP-ribose deacetylase (regulator of RNase III)
LSYPCNYVVHQCNCRTKGAKGLAESIFSKWPQANTYRNNVQRIVGTIDIFDVSDNNSINDNPNNSINNNPKNKKYVVNLYGQKKPSKADEVETWQKRLLWFESGLKQLASVVQPNTVVAFPYLIGCGLAGGNWLHYELKIREFSEQVKKIGVDVIIVCLQ